MFGKFGIDAGMDTILSSVKGGRIEDSSDENADSIITKGRFLFAMRNKQAFS